MRLVHCTSGTCTQVCVMFLLYVMTFILCFQEPKLTRSRVRQAVASTVGEVNFSPNKQVQYTEVQCSTQTEFLVLFTQYTCTCIIHVYTCKCT